MLQEVKSIQQKILQGFIYSLWPPANVQTFHVGQLPKHCDKALLPRDCDLHPQRRMYKKQILKLQEYNRAVCEVNDKVNLTCMQI